MGALRCAGRGLVRCIVMERVIIGSTRSIAPYFAQAKAFHMKDAVSLRSLHPESVSNFCVSDEDEKVRGQQ